MSMKNNSITNAKSERIQGVASRLELRHLGSSVIAALVFSIIVGLYLLSAAAAHAQASGDSMTDWLGKVGNRCGVTGTELCPDAINFQVGLNVTGPTSVMPGATYTLNATGYCNGDDFSGGVRVSGGIQGGPGFGQTDPIDCRSGNTTNASAGSVTLTAPSTPGLHCRNFFVTASKIPTPWGSDYLVQPTVVRQYCVNVQGAGNQPPTAPTITGPISGAEGTSYTFGFQGSDPDNDQVRYGIDWDNNGNVDQWAPGSGYVNSNTALNLTRTWTTAGSYTFQARTQDNTGALSGWAQHTIVISAAGGSCTGTVTRVETNGEDFYPVDCQSTSQGGNVPLPVCSRFDYTDGDTVTNATDIANGQCMIGPTPQGGGRCSYRLVEITEDVGSNCGGAQACTGSVCSLSEPIQPHPTMALDCTSTEVGPLGCDYGSFYRPLCEPVYPPSCSIGPSVDLEINGDSNPPAVSKSDPLVLDWTHLNAGTCTIYGAGLPGGQLTNVSNSGSHTIPGGTVGAGTETYTMICTSGDDVVNLTVNNDAPNPPVIIGPTSATAGDNNTFTFTGTDPNNDQVFYEIDWDNDGVVDARSPSSGFVPTGTSRNGTYAWPSSGGFAIQARTVDSDNARSSWALHTITINPGPPPPPPTADLQVSVANGPFFSPTGPVTIGSEDEVRLQWDSTNAGTCTGSGPGFSTGGNRNGTDVIANPSPGDDDIYFVTCDSQDSNVITIETGLANLNRPNITYVLSNTFDPTTNTYDSVTVRFNTRNDGLSSTIADPAYRVRFDRGNTGSWDATQTGQLGVLLPGEDPTIEVTFSNVPFGASRVEVYVDPPPPTNGVVTESNEADNDRQLVINSLAPDPGLFITANPSVVRNNEFATLTWGAINAYEGLTCTVAGPGVNEDPALLTAPNNSINTPNLTAKSVYILTCEHEDATSPFTASVDVEVLGMLEEI